MTGSKTAFITGATEGIGRAIAFALGRQGYRIGVCARNDARVELLLTELQAQGIDAAGAAGDVGNERDVASVVEQVQGTLGSIEVLINNAGIAILRPFDDMTAEDWDATMGTNVRGMFLVTKAVLPSMRRRRHGTIVNLASLAGRNGFVGGTAYCASKHAVLGFSRALMLEVREDDIRVIALCPGSVDTPLLRNQGMLQPDPDRILRPEDVAQVVSDVLAMPDGAMVSELDLRPTNP
ncbi:MAG: SDR family NAD(P)-dependent oxidoreductase [Gemmatimonadales bacterium]